jgi:hypothetical protein
MTIWSLTRLWSEVSGGLQVQVKLEGYTLVFPELLYSGITLYDIYLWGHFKLSLKRRCFGLHRIISPHSLWKKHLLKQCLMRPDFSCPIATIDNLAPLKPDTICSGLYPLIVIAKHIQSC